MKTLKEHVSPAVSAPAKEELLQDLVPVGSEPAAASRTPATPPLNRTGPTSSAQPLCPPCAVWWSVHSMITSVRWGKQSFSWNNFSCYSPQVRINFESLTLSDPDATGMCKTEYVQVTKVLKLSSSAIIKPQCAGDRRSDGSSGANPVWISGRSTPHLHPHHQLPRQTLHCYRQQRHNNF